MLAIPGDRYLDTASVTSLPSDVFFREVLVEKVLLDLRFRNAYGVKPLTSKRKYLFRRPREPVRPPHPDSHADGITDLYRSIDNNSSIFQT